MLNHRFLGMLALFLGCVAVTFTKPAGAQSSDSLADMIRGGATLGEDQGQDILDSTPAFIDPPARKTLTVASPPAVKLPPAGDSMADMIRQVSYSPTPTAPIEESESEDRSIAARLKRLQKPVGEISIAAPTFDSGTPENKASQYAPPEQAILITSLGTSVALPDRYSVQFCHRPLYYEQLNLERCGKSFGYFQNTVSGAQFIANTMALPYRMAKTRPDCPIAAGGDCRTCQSYPIKWNPFPLDRRALLTEVASLAGFSFLLL